MHTRRHVSKHVYTIYFNIFMNGDQLYKGGISRARESEIRRRKESDINESALKSLAIREGNDVGNLKAFRNLTKEGRKKRIAMDGRMRKGGSSGRGREWGRREGREGVGEKGGRE